MYIELSIFTITSKKVVFIEIHVMDNILNAVNVVIDAIDNLDVRESLSDSYYDSIEALNIIEGFFKEFTSKKWTINAKRIFLKNWRSPGYGSASFCALTFRILQLCDPLNTSKEQEMLLKSAMQIAEIAHEDVGVHGINHQELYEQFAATITGDDEWKLNKYQVPNIKSFLTNSRTYRQNGEDLKYAITLSLPEELYNHGEFTFIAPLFTNWHKDILDLPSENRKNDLKFIIDHLGETESHHFTSAIDGLKNYCLAFSLNLDTSILYNCNKNLLNNMASYYQKLMLAIVNAN